MSPVPPGSVIAVTGASGFIGSHVCASLLAAGYSVRAVVRNPQDEAKTSHLTGLTGAADRLTLHAGDLLQPGSYDEALASADAVVHTAAVVEIDAVKDAEETIVRPSLEGVQNVLGSADRASSIRRFVHTSSIISTMSFTSPPDTTFSEADWNDASTVANGDAYGYAKAQAERLVHAHTGKYDCIAMHPGVVLGPCLCKAHTKASVVVVRQMLFGNAQPSYNTAFVDVRDVADAHVKALMLPEASVGMGPRRFIVASDTQGQAADLEAPLRQLFPQYQLTFVPSVGGLAKVVLALPLLWRLFATEFQLGMMTARFKFANSRSKEELGVAYRPLEDTLRDSVTSMVDTGYVKPRKA